MKLTIDVVEILSRQVEIEADSIEDGLNKIRDMYDNEEIVLDEGDFNGDLEFNVVDIKKDETW